MGNQKTPGEILFEEYLGLSGITDFQFEKTFPESKKPPDFSFFHLGQPILLDIKDFRGEPKDFGLSGFYDGYAPIREKIDAGRRKFKNLKNYCCCLVLYNHDKPLVSLEPMFVYGAMLGDLAIQFPVETTTVVGDESQVRTVFAHGGKMLRYGKANRPVAPQNTTISAVIALGRLLVGQGLLMAWMKDQLR